MTLTLWACFCVPSNRKFTFLTVFPSQDFIQLRVLLKNSLRVNVGASVNLNGDSQLINYVTFADSKTSSVKRWLLDFTTVILNVGVTGSLKRLSPDYFGFPELHSHQIPVDGQLSIHLFISEYTSQAKGKGNQTLCTSLPSFDDFFPHFAFPARSFSAHKETWATSTQTYIQL